MKPAKKVSRSGVELIKRFEGYRRTAARLADDRWTIGYGHVKFAREGAEVSHDDAEALLVYDLIEIAAALEESCHSPLGQNQFDALASFAFNVGIENFKGSSVLRRVNEGDFTKASFALEIWRRAPFEGDVIVIDALVRRRAAEKALFLTPDAGFVPAPTPVLPPEIDFLAECRPPLRKPATVIASLDGPLAQAQRVPELSPEKPAPSMAFAAVDAFARRLNALVPDEGAPASPNATPTEASFPETSRPETLHAEADKSEPGEIVEPFLIPRELVKVTPEAQTHWNSGLPKLFAFSATGLLLFGFAVFWRLNAGAGEGVGADTQAISYVAGILGIILIFYAAYLLLKRFAGDDD
jgi:lysozyme